MTKVQGFEKHRLSAPKFGHRHTRQEAGSLHRTDCSCRETHITRKVSDLAILSSEKWFALRDDVDACTPDNFLVWHAEPEARMETAIEKGGQYFRKWQGTGKNTGEEFLRFPFPVSFP